MDQWITNIKALCKPESVHFCDGSETEFQQICRQLVECGTFIPLNQELRPDSYLVRTNPEDTARLEERTVICSLKQEDAGPTNRWEDPEMMRARLRRLFEGSMQGRVMYIVPFCMGPMDSPLAKLGIEITDSPYVVVSIYLMARIGKEPLEAIREGRDFVPCLHSLGVPLKSGAVDVAWPCRPDDRWVVHFPETREIWSFGSGYGGNALLCKKSLALRIASVVAKEEGWLAEHMLIVGITSPAGEKHYIAGAFPSACGKTNLAMLSSSLPGWKVECVGDDIAWMTVGEDGGLYALNPEAGFFGVAPGTSMVSNPHAMETIRKKTIFTNVAVSPTGDVWWQGMTSTPPDRLIDWRGAPWTPELATLPAHPNARFTASITQCPILDPAWNQPQGVPISAILLGTKRSDTMPLVFQALSWEHGVFLGAGLISETTAAAVGKTGKLRNDPFAMLPFCGYNMADYWRHWLAIGQRSPRLPPIFQVNWFRKRASGGYLWPGFGENIRVISWIFDRLSGKAHGELSPLGLLPRQGELSIAGLNVDWEELFALHRDELRTEVDLLKDFFPQFGQRLPLEIAEQLSQFEQRVTGKNSPNLSE